MRHPSVNLLFWVIFRRAFRFDMAPPSAPWFAAVQSLCAQAYPSIVCMSAMRTNSEFSACR